MGVGDEGTLASHSGPKLRWSVAAYFRAVEAARAPKLEGIFLCPTQPSRWVGG